MQWHNEPASWQRTAGVLRVDTEPGTDFWRVTGYGYTRDNGHLYGQVAAGDVDVSAVVRGQFRGQYDQAGLMLRADERVWLKCGVECVDGRPRLSTVVTVGFSSWMMTGLPEGAAKEGLRLRLSRRDEAVEIRYETSGRAPELAALVYLPPDREMLAGVMCAAPESEGFTASFHDLRVSLGGPLPAR